MWCLFSFFFFKQKTAYEMRISDWSSDVCSSDLRCLGRLVHLRDEYAGERQVGGMGQPSHAYLFRVQFIRGERRRRARQREHSADAEIGRASCRERVCQYV